MRTVVHVTVAASVIALSAAGCAAVDGDPASPPRSAPPSAVDPDAGPTSAATTAGSPVTELGIVRHGVAPGCLILRAGSRDFLLLEGTDPVPATGVPVGVPVRVTGELLTGLASYCQQGTPLRIDSVSSR